jgi:ADP-ribose pyrophosphatase YjhB (NUDIX family)
MDRRPAKEKRRDPRVSVRVAVVVRFEHKVLLAIHGKGEKDYWVFPGGRLQHGETLEECGRRELKEEANIDVRVGQLLYVSDRTSGDTQDVNLFFLGYLERGEVNLGFDPEIQGRGVLKRLDLVSASEFRELEFFPPEVKAAILQDWEDGFPARGRYIGPDC